jgi:type II secretory pathway pseudopilin PulG
MKNIEGDLRHSESGHLLLALMIGLTVMAIFLTVVAQQWSTLERREKEKELVFRGNQYIKAIKKYQQEHGGAYRPGSRLSWSWAPGSFGTSASSTAIPWRPTEVGNPPADPSGKRVYQSQCATD